MIAVDDGHKVVQPVFVASHGSLVDAALTLFAVAHQHVCPPRFPVHFGSNSHAHTNAQAVAQCATVHLDTGHLNRWVTTQHRAEPPQCVEHFRLQEALGLQRHIKSLHTMSLRQHETVSLR